ncbi:DUF4374 domain-containing protein [Coprobacter tertius]|nr:DUF4374 domain-containing protein [Coprobacter tertius]
MNKLFSIIMAGYLAVSLVSCEDKEGSGGKEIANAPYVLSLGITSNGNTAYYVVTTDDLMKGTISAANNNGLEQNGYRDYEQGGQTIYSIGGLGVTNVIGIVRGPDGFLHEKGDFVFNNTLNAFTSVDGNQMVGIEVPGNKQSGDKLTFYTVDNNSVAITKTVNTTPVFPMDQNEWPSISGMCYSDGNIYVTYFPMSPVTYETAYMDTAFVAVYSYPEMTFKTLMKDRRIGPAGSWNAFNGIFKVESGDMYVMGNSAIANGFSQSGTTHAGFIRIPKGETMFDGYHFDFEAATNGLKPAHIKYVGNGIVFAEVSTVNPQTAADRWLDRDLKCCIIDLNNKTVTDVEGIPVHNGNGGRRFSVLVDGGYVYCPVTTSEGTYIYRVDPSTAKAERGAKIATTFVAGFFRLN